MFKYLNFKLIVALIFVTAVLAGGAFYFENFASANSCEKTYGGGKECDRGLRIKKVVRIGDSGDYKESVKAKKGEIVTFKVEINNTGDLDIKDLDFKDLLPEELELVEGDLTQDFKVLDNGDDKKIVIYIKAKVKDAQFQSGVSKCVVNTASVKADVNGDDNRETYRDTAVVCFGEELAELPKTGNESMIAYTLFGLGMVLIGFGIKRFVA